MDKNKQIDEFLKHLKVVIGWSSEPRDPDENDWPYYDYDIVLLHDGKKVLKSKFGTGSNVTSKDIKAFEIVQSLFHDAAGYAANPDLGEFLDEFGYVGDGKSVKRGIKAWEGCKEIHDLLMPVVMNNCAWNDGTDSADDHMQYLFDIDARFDDDDFDRELIPLEWDADAGDY